MSTVKLADCCEFFSGGTPTKGKAEYWNGEIPWFSPKDIKSFELNASQDRITEVAVKESTARLLGPGAILVVSRSGVLAHTLPVGIVRQPSTFNQDIKALVPTEGVDPEFVAFFLLASQRRVLKEGVKRGPTVHSLIAGFIEDLEIPNIGLAEQRQIAARLKAQLAEVETARQAVQVRLRDTRLLRARTLKAFFAELDGAPKKKLGDHAHITSGVTPARDNSTYWQPAEVPWVKTGEIDFEPITTVRESISRKALAECSLSLLPPRTVLIAITGEGKTRGRSAVLEIEATTNQHSVAVLPNNTWEPDFLQLWLQASYHALRELSEGRGGSRSALSGAQIKALEVPAPSKTEQQQLVARIQAAMTEIDAIERASQAALEDIDRLPSRVLAQAFEE
ncbi:restriction endonuclease subunit S [Stutzerimonas frequens]